MFTLIGSLILIFKELRFRKSEFMNLTEENSFCQGSSSKALFNFAPRELLSITQAKFLCKRLFRVLLKSFLKSVFQQAEKRSGRSCRKSNPFINSKNPGLFRNRGSGMVSLTMSYFHWKYNQLSSAIRCFTVLFGMGRSGTTSLWSSGKGFAARAANSLLGQKQS